MRNWFTINGQFFRCVDLLFGWCLSPSCFIKVMRPMVRFIRDKLGYRCLRYMDDFCIAPTDGSRLASGCCSRPRTPGEHSSELRPKSKGRQRRMVRITKLDQLGFRIDTAPLVFGIPTSRLVKIQEATKALVNASRRNRRLVDTQLL
jgi:hypothetical protein